ncbi:MAG: HlyD family efflux transporter periplasmic adaptor subunit [Hyphomicrobiales bacterium]|nr:HlyD family efflux transporter periplasmic adaptor subunit [Hyphomicrobiales bacterium]MCP5370804.1 HlyD family efflux transporter periplasmic adaptor subunit [Hyphomicrobiales bacterium]
MKRAFLFLAVLVVLAGCEEPDPDLVYGYAEGRFRLLAPESAGLIETLLVAEGEELTAGSVIAHLDSRLELARLDEAQARAEAAEARLRDSSQGGRAPEIRAARELLAQAQAQAREARDDLGRVRPLFDKGVVPRARLDTAEAAARSADARVSELRERLTLVELPARENVIAAQKSDLEAAQAAVAAAREALAKRTLASPGPGRVERLLREPGEMAGPTAPILRYLPTGAMVAIGFIPEAQLGRFALGDRLSVACDGCADGLTVTVTSISEKAAFTAPTIFSDRERARLVFRMEARFAGDAPPIGTPLRLRRLP